MKHRKIEPGTLVEFTWIDASGAGGWRPLHTIDGEPIEIISVGGVLMTNKRCITIGQSLDFENMVVDNFLTVPWSYIKKLRRLEVV